ncbi:MAG: hypothetical protein A2287_05115 [Candidatus Melainabacteria bacterium RIFOXYA12_FULL_32_12]|nr:MAG: hypothetical protein A2255_06325 [Candidatus Melainabacteria bacterium RIFOXYA2_FULL_32_9]OGI28902.1 MAG: hypothetical protein A2287_05115 [Candidatus Melainabacteria bacterium RIFOXYA12_FULL_32_12]
MLPEASCIKINSFNLSQSITFKKLFSKIELSASARLIIHCLVAHWNPQKGLVFPKQETIMEETGIRSNKSITQGIEELKAKKLVLTTKKGTKLNYYFTNVFFELVEVTGFSCKNYMDKAVKNTGTCHEQKREQINNKVLSFQNKGGYDRPDGQNYVSVESTKKYIDEQKKVKIGSPLDYTYEEAKKYLEELPDLLHNSFFACELRKKWGL